jgi:hypothetical protein
LNHLGEVISLGVAVSRTLTAWFTALIVPKFGTLGSKMAVFELIVPFFGTIGAAGGNGAAHITKKSFSSWTCRSKMERKMRFFRLFSLYL